MLKKIHGSLVGAAAGDAMGAATEIRTRQQIEEFFGGYVTDFYKPPKDTFARGNEPGQVTDDFSVAYIACKEIVANKGTINEEIATEALLKWASIDKYFNRFAGPTTRASIAKIQGTEVLPADGFVPVNQNSQATNGAAMKSAPFALFSFGDVDKAIDDAITMCKVTHPNNNALAGAAAVAAATAKALQEDSNFFDVIKAGIYGARKGNEIGLKVAHPVAACNIEKKIKLAVGIGLMSDSLSDAIDEISDVIGSGLSAAEAVPAAFGLMVAAGGDTVKAIEAAVNIGDDTDTVAIMIGGILGALNGIDSMPSDWTKLIDSANEFELEKLAQEILDLR
ncbi:MAG: hypothetical protein GX222_06635 [Ruminococcaceae bacterium]|nr:hypothetical protein [Oscillospiraceae bacterium]